MPVLKALFVDDSKMKQYFIKENISRIDIGAKIDLTCYTNPVEGLKKAITEDYNIIILDYNMPEMNGLEFIRIFRKTMRKTPVLMVTSEKDDPDLKIEALRSGVSDFLTYPFNSAEFQARVTNLISMELMQRELENNNKLLEVRVLDATRDILEREQETLSILANLTEYKDAETELHTKRVALYSRLLAQQYGFSDRETEIIYCSAPLHDIGKIGIPDNVLLKKGTFSDDEYNIMKGHTTIGYKILENTQSEFLIAGKDIALSHHERFDGSGYPYGKRGDEIPIQARIVAIADVFDALLSVRPYKKAWDFDEAVRYLIEQKGRQFDPVLVDVFLQNIDAVKNIFNTFKK